MCDGCCIDSPSGVAPGLTCPGAMPLACTMRLCSIKGFGTKGKESEDGSQEVASTSSPDQPLGVTEADKRWRLKAYDVVEWREWLESQREFASLPSDARDVYVQVMVHIPPECKQPMRHMHTC